MLKHRLSTIKIASIGRLNQSVLRMNRSGVKGVHFIKQTESTYFSLRMMSSSVENPIIASAENSIVVSTTAENSTAASTSSEKSITTSVENPVFPQEKFSFSPLDQSFFCAQPIHSSLVGSCRDVNFVWTQLDESRPVEHRVEFLVNLANQMERSGQELSFPYVLLPRLSPLLESLNLDTLSPVSWALRGMGFSCMDPEYVPLITKTVKKAYEELAPNLAMESALSAPTEEFARNCRNFLIILRNWNTTWHRFSLPAKKSIVDVAFHHTNRSDMAQLFRVLGYVGVKFSDLSPRAKDSMVSFISQEANIIRLSRSSKLSSASTNSVEISGAVEPLQGQGVEKLSSSQIDKIVFGFVKFKIDLAHSDFNVNDFLTILSDQLENSLNFQVDPSVKLAYDYYVNYFEENFPEEKIRFLPQNFLDPKAAQVPKYVMRVFQAFSYTNLSAITLPPNLKKLLLDSLLRTYPYMDFRAATKSIERLFEMELNPIPPKLQSVLVASSGRILFTDNSSDKIPLSLSKLSLLLKNVVPNTESENFGRGICAHLEEKVSNQTPLKKRDIFSSVMLLSTLNIKWASINPKVQEIIATHFLSFLPVMTTKDAYRLSAAFRRMNCNMKQLTQGRIVASPHFEKAIVAAVRTAEYGFVKGVDKDTNSEEASLDVASQRKRSGTQPFSPVLLLENLSVLNAPWIDMSHVTRHAFVEGLLTFSVPPTSASSSLSSYTTSASVKITLKRQMDMLREIKNQCDMWDKLFALGLGKNDLAKIIQKDPNLTKKALAWMYISLQEIQHTLQVLPETAQLKEEKTGEKSSEKQDATNVSEGAAISHSPTFSQDLFQDLSVFYKHVLYLSAKFLEFVPVWDADGNTHIRPLVDSLFASFFSENQIKGSNLTSVLRNLSFLKWRYHWFSHKPEIKHLLEEALFNVAISNNPVAIAAAAQSTNLGQMSKRLNSLALMGFPLPVSQEAMMTVNIVLDENAEKAKSMLWSDASLKDLPKLMIAQSPLISACFAASPALAGFWEVVALRCLAENQAAQDSMSNKSPRENSPPTVDAMPKSSLRPKSRYDLNKVPNATNFSSPEAEDASSFEVYGESRKHVVSILNSLTSMAKNTLTPHGKQFRNINLLEDQRNLMAKNHVFESTMSNLILMQSLEVSSWDVQRFIFGSIESEKLDDWNFSKGMVAKDENQSFSAEQWIVALHSAKHCHWSRFRKSLRDEVFRTFLSLPAAYPSGSTASSHFTSPFEELISPMLQVLSDKNIQWTFHEMNLRQRLFRHLFKDKDSLQRILRHQKEVYPTSLLDHPNASNDGQNSLTMQPLHITKFLPEVHGGNPRITNLPMSLASLQDTLIPTFPNIHRYQLTSLIDGLAKLNVAWKDLNVEFMDAFFEKLSKQSFSLNDVHAVARLAHNFASMIYDMPWESFQTYKNNTSLQQERKNETSQRQMLVTYNICRRLLQILAQFPDNAFFGKDSSASSLFTCLETFLPKEAVVLLYSDVYPFGQTRPKYLHPIIQNQLPSSLNQFEVPASPKNQMKKESTPPEISDHHIHNNRSELAGVSSLMATWLSTGLRTTALREELAETLARCLLEFKGKFDDKGSKASQDRLVIKCNFAGVEYYYPISIAVLLRRSGVSSNGKAESVKDTPIAFIDIGEMVMSRPAPKQSVQTSSKDADEDTVNSDAVVKVRSASKGARLTSPPSKTPHNDSNSSSPSPVVVPASSLDSIDAKSPDISTVEDVSPVVASPLSSGDDDSDDASVATASSADADANAAGPLPFDPTARAAGGIALPKTYSTTNKFNKDLVNSRTYKLKSALYNKHYPGVPLYFLSIQHYKVRDAATVLAIKILQDQQNKKK